MRPQIWLFEKKISAQTLTLNVNFIDEGRLLKKTVYNIESDCKSAKNGYNTMKTRIESYSS